MPPSSKRKVRDRTKDAPGSPEGERAQRTRGLDPAVVKQFLGMLQRRDRLGPDFFADGELLQWNEWLDAVPARAAEAPDGKSLLPVQMPLKCLPRPAAGSNSAGPSSLGQEEIITYANADGREFGVAERRRQYDSRKALRLSDVPQGSVIAIRADTEAATQPGYRTPFWVGDVIEAFGDRDGALETVTIHFRMPQAAAGLFCDDVTKPWNLACHALHTYDGTCERKLACKAAAQKAGSNTSKFMYTCEAAEILETKLEFNASRTLKAQSKKRLAESAPEKGAWNDKLGI